MSKGKCKNCLVEYLRALKYETNNADETIHEQLGKIIRIHPDKLNKACKQIAQADLETINAIFESAIDILHDKVKNSKAFRTKIPLCLPAKKGK
jgi:hypothetical protein